MPKRKETLELEEKLHYMCHKRRLYGCEEVTIGFARNGHGNEIVDYCTMDSKGILKCYEIKVTIADLKSKNKKSWYGHYNYLFVTTELYEMIYSNLNDYVPDYVGVAIPCLSSWSDGVEVKRAAKKQTIGEDQEVMLKESLIRSMYYKMQKYRDAADIQKVSELKRKLSKSEKDISKNNEEMSRLKHIINTIEKILRRYYDKDICLEEIVQKWDEEEIILPGNIYLNLSERGKKKNEIIQDNKIY